MDIVDACSSILDRNTAIKGVRNLCRYFGGGMYYIPAKKRDGSSLKEIEEMLCEAVGERSADIIIGKIMAMFGSVSLYIPMERKAFRDVIAEEIYRRNMHENTNMRELYRDYGLSFTHAYKLWKMGRKIKLSREGKK